MKIDSKARFSLLDNGIIDQPSCRLLLINGMLDELFPIEDSMLMMQHGSVKEARFFQGIKHMGEPYAMPMIIQWVKDLFAGIRGESDINVEDVEVKELVKVSEVNGINGVNGMKKANGVNGTNPYLKADKI
jgi:hypothetical protein